MHLSWVELHGAATHMPIAFLLAVPVFDIGAWLLRKPEWRIVSFWLLVGAVLLAVPSLATGWIAGNDLHYTAGGEVSVAFARHRLAAFVASIIACLLLYWRVKTQDRLSDRARAASIALALCGALAVAYTGYMGGDMVFEGSGAQSAAAPLAAASPATTLSPTDAKLISTGQSLFVSNHCQSCHILNGVGAAAGPDLTHEARRHADVAWQVAHLKDPAKMTPGSGMPPFGELSSTELRSIAAYMASRT